MLNEIVKYQVIKKNKKQKKNNNTGPRKPNSLVVIIFPLNCPNAGASIMFVTS